MHFSKTLLVSLFLTFSIFSNSYAMHEEEIQQKLNTVRQKISERIPEFEWSEVQTDRTEGILIAKIGGNEYPFCHASLLGVTKLNSDLIQNKHRLGIPVDFVPYPQPLHYEEDQENWFY